MVGILFIILLLIGSAYVALGIRFAVQAAIAEKAVGHTPKAQDLLVIGSCWLPLFISDPKDFNSVELLRIREERREQKGYERAAHLSSAQQETVKWQVEVEKGRAELEALRYKAYMETERHRQTVDEFVNQRTLKELSASAREDSDDDSVEAEIVFDHKDPNLPRRYNNGRTIGGEKQVWDAHDNKWVPEWAMLPGYRYEQYG